MRIDFKVVDQSGQIVCRLGDVKDGYPEEGAENFKVVLGDQEGKVVELNPLDAGGRSD